MILRCCLFLALVHFNGRTMIWRYDEMQYEINLLANCRTNTTTEMNGWRVIARAQPVQRLNLQILLFGSVPNQ